MAIYITKKQTPLQSKEATAGTSDISVTPDDGYEGMTSVTVHPTNHTGTYTPSPNTAVNDMGASHNKRYVNTSGMIVPSGNKSISENGTNIDVASYSTVSVSVPGATLDGDAIEDNVLSGKTFYSDSTTKKTGTMTNQSSWTSLNNKADAFSTKIITIPEGYHNGSGSVRLASLSSQTGVDSGKTAIDASHVLTGYQGWVNGSTVTGSMTNVGKQTITLSASSTSATITQGYHNGTGTASAAKSTVKKNSGTNLNTGTWSASLNAGDSVAVTAGLVYAGSVTANSLASQTGVDSGKTAIDASHVVSGYQGWVNGNKVSGSYTLPSGTKDNTGTPLTTNGDHTITGLDSYAGVKVNVNVPVPTLDGDAVAGNVLSGKTFYSDSYTKLTGSITSKAVATYNTSSSDQTISAGQYLSGAQTIKAVTTENITAGNIKSGVTVKVGDANDDDRILSVTGTYTPTPTETILWQNSAPNDATSAITVTLSQSIRNFDVIKVVIIGYPTSDMTETSVMQEVPEFITTGGSGQDASYFCVAYAQDFARVVKYVSDTQVYIGKAGTSSGSSRRSNPYKIIGIKY